MMGVRMVSQNDKKAWNRRWVYFGLFPFVPSCILAITLGRIGFLFAPLYGFCPLDVYQLHSSPAPLQLLAWGLVSSAICVALAAYALFKPPIGVVFGLIMWSSTLALLLRGWEAIKGIQ
jgi:hypothetical protein